MTIVRKMLAVAMLAAIGIATTACTQPGGTVLGDLEVERAVFNKIYGNPDLVGEQILVSCFGGEVTLTGTVENQQERQLAESLAAGIPGVTKVVNALTID